MFSDMPGSFLREAYWWMAEHGCGEEVYAQYSVLEHVDAETTVSALKEKTRLDILAEIRTRSCSYSLPRGVRLRR